MVLKSIFQKMFLIGKEKAQNIINKTFQVKLLIEILQANHEIDLRQRRKVGIDINLTVSKLKGFKSNPLVSYQFYDNLTNLYLFTQPILPTVKITKYKDQLVSTMHVIIKIRFKIFEVTTWQRKSLLCIVKMTIKYLKAPMTCRLIIIPPARSKSNQIYLLHSSKALFSIQQSVLSMKGKCLGSQ